ncbi:MAG: hypothetical protein CL857_06195 [Cryomorphaceae bacterium]|nr:hypothetical protein [Cryomorphaceae bacterium]
MFFNNNVDNYPFSFVSFVKNTFFLFFVSLENCTFIPLNYYFMKLLYSLLFVSCSVFCAYSQHNLSIPCSLDESNYRVLVRKSFQVTQPNHKFSPRALKPEEICLVKSLQEPTNIVIYILDARHEVIVYPLNTDNLD